MEGCLELKLRRKLLVPSKVFAWLLAAALCCILLLEQRLPGLTKTKNEEFLPMEGTGTKMENVPRLKKSAEEISESPQEGRMSKSSAAVVETAVPAVTDGIPDEVPEEHVTALAELPVTETVTIPAEPVYPHSGVERTKEPVPEVVIPQDLEVKNLAGCIPELENLSKVVKSLRKNVQAIDSMVEEKKEQRGASGFLIDEAGMLYGLMPKMLDLSDGSLALPAEGCVGVRKGAFLGKGAGILEIYIPANIMVIEEGAFAGLDLLEWIEVDENNPGYFAMDGVLFDSSITTLLAFPNGRIGAYPVPAGVTRISDRAFANTSLSILDLWMCPGIEIGAEVFGGMAGTGIAIKAPRDGVEQYRQIFSGYDVKVW